MFILNKFVIGLIVAVVLISSGSIYYSFSLKKQVKELEGQLQACAVVLSDMNRRGPIPILKGGNSKLDMHKIFK